MKRYISMAEAFLMLLLMVELSGCGLTDTSGDSPYKHLYLEEEAHLADEASSPFCDFSIDYTCLDEENDSIAALVNRTLQHEFLGEEFASLSPEAAVDSFKNVHLRNYKEETGVLYRTDLARNGAGAEVPQWYNQTYSLVTFVEEGRGGCMNASANWFVDTGGAHPNQWSRWLNFDFETGKLLALEDVFVASARAEVGNLLLDKLIRRQAELHPEENVSSLEDLHKLGFLQLTEMYIPDNFLLGKEAVLFLFNRYDIAPYSAGEIVIEVPYGEIGQWMEIFNNSI